MTPPGFIYPFPKATAPGFEYRPALLPSDYIGPRLDCPLPLRDDDSPLDAGKFDAWEHVETSVWLEELQADVPIWTATSTGPAPVNPALPVPPGVVFANLPPCCDFWHVTPGRTVEVIIRPDPVQTAPVPLPGALGLMIGILCIAAIAAILKHNHALETIR